MITAPVAGATVSGTVAVNVNATDNVGVARVELRVNGVAVATDTASPFAFGWDSTKLPNGAATLVAVAYDAAGNATSSTAVGVSVANGAPVVADTTPPLVAILNPLPGTSIAGNSFTVSTSASDNVGAAGITQSLYIDGALKASVTGSSLVYKWNTRRLATGPHVIQVVARDAAGNSASATVQVTR